MSHISTILLNGVPEKDGISAFARPVLFCKASDWVTSALEDEKFGKTSLICPVDELPFADEREALRAVELPEDAEHVMLIAKPMPQLTAEDYAHAAELHTAVGNAVTLFCCEGQSSADTVLLDADTQVSGVGSGGRQSALPAAVFRKDILKDMLKEADSFYDLIGVAVKKGHMVGTCTMPQIAVVADAMSAYIAQKALTMRVNMGHIAAGVQIFAPESTYIAPGVEIGQGAAILPNCMIHAGCKIGAGAVIGPNTILEDAEIGEGTSVNNSQVYESVIGAHATVGPFAYVRPGCKVGDNTRIGDFVELKKAEIGNGTKVSHLTYIGDASVGERVNFGCGTVVVNYDGYTKNKTIIGDDCFIGCNTNLVAPVALGDRVFTAAGTTVTKDVPDGALAVARSRQTTLDGWNDRRRERMGGKK